MELSVCGLSTVLNFPFKTLTKVILCSPTLIRHGWSNILPFFIQFSIHSYLWKQFNVFFKDISQTSCLSLPLSLSGSCAVLKITQWKWLFLWVVDSFLSFITSHLIQHPPISLAIIKYTHTHTHTHEFSFKLWIWVIYLVISGIRNQVSFRTFWSVSRQISCSGYLCEKVRVAFDVVTSSCFLFNVDVEFVLNSLKSRNRLEILHEPDVFGCSVSLQVSEDQRYLLTR
jgi:hypothetical protein